MAGRQRLQGFLISLFALLAGVPIAAADARASEWPVRHGDIANTDFLDIPGPSHLAPAWFHGPRLPIGTYVAVGPDDLVVTYSYNSDADPPGEHQGCRLWALDAQSGEVRWCSRDVTETVTSIAISGEGAIFVSDGRQLRRFESDGKIAWERPVSEETSSVTFLPDGVLLVADYAGFMRLYSPDNGEELANPFRLPAQPNPPGQYAEANAPGMLLTGVGEDYLDRLIRHYFGYGAVIQDMPAVHPASGRIFVASNSADGATGALWAVDVDRSVEPHRLDVACTAEIGVGSDTSPAVSHDGTRVYVAAQGYLHAVDAQDCEEIWRVPRPGFTAASPSVSPDGMVYLLAGGTLTAIRDQGEAPAIAWEYDVTKDAQSAGFQSGIFDSAILLSRDHAYVTTSWGIRQPGYIIPFLHKLYVLDRHDGEFVSSTPLGEESDSPPSMSREGWIFVPTKALARGHSLSMRILDRLPADLRGVTIRPPRTGVYAFRPAPSRP